MRNRELPAWTPRLLLAAAMACSAAAVLYVTRGEGFLGDEWGYYASYPGFDLKEMLGPRVGHLQFVVILLYKGVVELFGPSDVAFRLLLVFFILLCAGLTYELVRRRVGDWLALGPAILVLTFGSGGETYATTLGIVITMTIAMGLGALLLLERDDTIGDVGACLLLLLGLASYAPMLAFLVGAAAVVVFARGERPQWRRAWIFAVPAVLYLAWRAWSPPGQGDQAEVTFENLLQFPVSMLDSLAAALSAMSGLFATGGNVAPALIPLGWGQVLAALLVLGTILLLVERRGRPLERWVWPLLAMPLAYWFSIAAVSDAARPPEAARYQLLSAIFLILLFAQLAKGVRVGPRATAVVLAAFVLAALPNIAALKDHGHTFRVNSDENRAELGALELVRDNVDRDFAIEAAGEGISIPDLLIPASQYLAIADEHGSPAFSVEEIQAAPDGVRQAADVLLVRALEIEVTGLEPGWASVRHPAMADITAGHGVGARAEQRGRCLWIVPISPDAAFELYLPRGGFTMLAEPGEPPALTLFRFGSPGPAKLASPIPGPVQVVRIPPDSAPQPWGLHIDLAAPLTLCPLRPA